MATEHWLGDCDWGGMANGAPAWMIAMPCRPAEALHDAAPHEVTLRDLPPRHKRELASLAVAGLASSLCALVMNGSATSYAPVLDSAPLFMQVAATPQAPASTLAAREVPAAARRVKRSSGNSAQVEQRLASYSVLEPVAPAPSVRVITQLADAELPAPSSRRGPSPLKRILFGSGQYRVRPFPTVSEQ